MNDVAIIIDCWETWWSRNCVDTSPDYRVFKNIKNFLEITPDITTVILATYESTDTLTTIWHTNSLKLLGKEAYDKKIQTDKETPFTENWQEFRKTDKLLLDWICDKKYQIAMHYQWEFEILLKTIKIENIYICGQYLDMCLRHRPLGYDNLSKFILDNNLPSKILVKDDCVDDGYDNFLNPKIHKGWKETVTKGVYEYQYSSN
jgi:hypothetical protein